MSVGLFLKIFEFTLIKDAKLRDIVNGIPQNAKYTSHNMQNKVIGTMASLGLQEIKNKYVNADTAGFCLKSNGTRERCNMENLSIMIWFVHNSVPEERLIGLLGWSQLGAEYITAQILKHLSDGGYSSENIIS